MNSKRSRLARKARKVERNEFERQFDNELGKAKRARDKALHEASQTYKQGVEDLRAEHTKAAARAWTDYRAIRDNVVKQLAAEEAKAA